MKSFSENYETYVDQFGLVQPEPNTTSDNGIRFSAESIVAALVEDKRKLGNGAELSTFITDRVRAIKKCRKEPGLLVRYPGCTTQEGPDDYYAACFVGYMFDRQLALDIYSYGMKAFGMYRDQPSAKWYQSIAWFRQGALYSHVKHCAGFKLNIAEQILICIGLHLSGNSKEQDHKMLMVFVVEAFKGHYSLIDSCILRWKDKLKEHYPRGVGQILGEYYSVAHYEHPNSRYLMDYFC